MSEAAKLDKRRQQNDLSVIPKRSEIDLPAAEKAVQELLLALGIDVTREEFRNTPRRVARAFAEQLQVEPFNLTTFPNDEGYDEMVLVKDIPFHSLCAHHLLPFFGTAHVAYIPEKRILGLSKLARVVDLFAKDLQVQERLTSQIAQWLDTNLRPKGVGVILEAEHTCMTLRGIQKPGTRTVTSALLGALRDDVRTRTEFLTLAKGVG